MNSGKERMIGLGIIAVGLIILLGKLGVFSFLGQNFWPLLILIPGIILHAMYMMRKVSPIMLLPVPGFCRCTVFYFFSVIHGAGI